MLNLLNRQFFKFLIIGTFNTVLGYTIIFILLNIFGLSYFFSTLVGYIIGNILGFCLNKCFTFQNKGRFLSTYFKFVIVFLASYIISAIGGKIISDICCYYLKILRINVLLKENFAVFAGAPIYVIVNYYGNRFFTFKDSAKDNKGDLI